ncbi:TetR/AcrR family transcriptional regulator [Solibacillus silvestris]|uniref:TetR/AcrR family transcriptional regulator n=1 Tax=Solibacillus silvestris TaxID=76853 RepID=UPI003F7D277B
MQAKQLKRQQMLAAARHLFTEYGFERTTMQKIADEASVGVATLFRYFPRKELLIIEIIKNVIEEMVPHFDDINSSSSSGYEKIEAIIDAYIQYVYTAKRDAVTLLESFEYYITYNPVEEDLLNEINQSYTKIGRVMNQALEQGVEDGSISEENAKNMTVMTMMNLFGIAIKKYAFLSLLPNSIVPVPSKKGLEEVKQLILSYLKRGGTF